MILKINVEELAKSLALMDMALDQVPCEIHEPADFEWYTSLYDRYFSVITEHSPELQTEVTEDFPTTGEEQARMEECLSILKAQQSIPWATLESSTLLQLEEFMELEFENFN